MSSLRPEAAKSRPRCTSGRYSSKAVQGSKDTREAMGREYCAKEQAASRMPPQMRSGLIPSRGGRGREVIADLAGSRSRGWIGRAVITRDSRMYSHAVKAVSTETRGFKTA